MRSSSTLFTLMGATLAWVVSSAAVDMTIPSCNSTNSAPRCSRRPRRAVIDTDCRFAIAEFNQKYPADIKWQWIHSSQEPPGRNFVIAPQIWNFDTCDLQIDFTGPELVDATHYPPFCLANLAGNIIDECIVSQRREGGRAVVRIEDEVTYTIDVGYVGDIRDEAWTRPATTALPIVTD